MSSAYKNSVNINKLEQIDRNSGMVQDMIEGESGWTEQRRNKANHQIKCE